MLHPSNAVFKLWSSRNGRLSGGALVLLWYGESPSSAFDVMPFADVGKLMPYEPPPATARKEKSWASAARDDGRRREERGAEYFDDDDECDPG